MTRTSQSVISKHPGPSAEPACKLNAFPKSNNSSPHKRCHSVPGPFGPTPRSDAAPRHLVGATVSDFAATSVFKRRKVAALFGLLPVDETGIGLLSPALWSAVYLSREDGCRDRQAELAS